MRYLYIYMQWKEEEEEVVICMEEGGICIRKRGLGGVLERRRKEYAMSQGMVKEIRVWVRLWR